jgi:hypothetical protein
LLYRSITTTSTAGGSLFSSTFDAAFEATCPADMFAIARILPLLLLLLSHLDRSFAALASNPGDYNVITCGANKGKTVSLRETTF